MTPPATPAPAAPSGPRVVDAIRQNKQRALRWTRVPEWDLPGYPCELGFGALVAADLKAVRERNPKDDLERSVMLLIHKAVKRDGTPAFDFGDFQYLLADADYLVLDRVLDFMYGRMVSYLEAKKEVGETPTSVSG